MAERIIRHDVYDEYIDNMVAYSIAVIRKRAVAEIRDGFKPIQRRIIYDIYNDQTRGMTKSQKIAGDVIGKYSPHGDSAAYEAFRPIINWFQCKLPLLEGQGNFGTVSGSGASSARYTEAKLSQFCMDVLISDMETDKHVVDYSPNYDNTTVEPDYLPCKVPLLLINGSSGIAVGISASIPTHNLTEVLEVTRGLLKDPKMKFTLIPDQCQPTMIINQDWEAINNCGGTFRVRGITEIGEFDKCPAIFIKSLPDGVRTNSIHEAIEKMASGKQVPMIKDVIDKSKAKVEMIIQLQKGADPYFVRDLLYKKTNLETSIMVNFEVIDGIESKHMSYREYLLAWIEYRKTTKFRVYSLKLKNTTTEMHKMKTYVQAMESGYIDEIVALIRRQKKVDDRNVLTEFIIKKCKMTKLQAEFILHTDIRHLAEGYLPIYKARYIELEKIAKECENFLINPSRVVDEIDKELVEIEKKYAIPRMAKIIKAEDDSNIPKGTFKIVITENNYVRKLLLDDKAGAIRKDAPKFILKVENTDNLLLFDNKGKVFKIPVHKINVTDKSSAGVDLKLLIRNCTADIAAVINEDTLHKVLAMKKSKHFLVVTSEGNFIKKMDLEDFENVPASGLLYSRLADGDSIIDVKIIPAAFDVIIYSGHKALRIPLSEIPVYKRASQGVLAMNTKESITGLSLVYPDAKYAIVATQSGKVNKFDIAGLAKSKRAKAGNSAIGLKKTDKIVSIFGVNDTNSVMLVCANGRKVIPVAEIPVGSSVSQGVKLTEASDGVVVKAEIV